MATGAGTTVNEPSRNNGDQGSMGRTFKRTPHDGNKSLDTGNERKEKEKKTGKNMKRHIVQTGCVKCQTYEATPKSFVGVSRGLANCRQATPQRSRTRPGSARTHQARKKGRRTHGGGCCETASPSCLAVIAATAAAACSRDAGISYDIPGGCAGDA